VARAALTWATLDVEGNIQCESTFEELLVRVAEGVAAGFVWPPRPGSCSTAHWAPPASRKEIAEHRAAWDARNAAINAEIQAKKLADEAESRRCQTPPLLTDDELRGRVQSAEEFKSVCNQMHAELVDELARRGLA